MWIFNFQVLTFFWIFYRFQTAYTPRAAEFMADKPALVSFVEEMEATLIEIINSISDKILRRQMVPNGDGKIKKEEKNIVCEEFK